MAYPAPFLRLVMYGSLYTDIFNMGLNFVPSPVGGPTVPEPDTAMLDLIHPVLSNWWDDTTPSTGPGFISQAKLQGFKLNRIGTDGRYMDPVTHEHVYTTPINGPTASFYAPQLTAAVSLRTTVERGLASKGRIYLPPVGALNSLGSDGRLSITQATELATAVRRLLVELNAAMLSWGGGDAPAVVGVASDRGASGQFRIVSKVACGRVVDTMRSRRNSLDEGYVEAAALP